MYMWRCTVLLVVIQVPSTASISTHPSSIHGAINRILSFILAGTAFGMSAGLWGSLALIVLPDYLPISDTGNYSRKVGPTHATTAFDVDDNLIISV